MGLVDVAWDADDTAIIADGGGDDGGDTSGLDHTLLANGARGIGGLAMEVIDPAGLCDGMLLPEDKRLVPGIGGLEMDVDE